MIFVCLSGKRTGSTFLERCLASHPDIDAHGELFTLKDAKRNENFLFWKTDKAVTFKLMYNQCQKLELMPLIKENNLPVIHLIRRSPYNKVLSDLAVKKMNEVHASEFMRYVMEYKRNVDVFRMVFSEYEFYMEVFMEDMIGNANKRKAGGTFMVKNISDDLCGFLGVKKRRLWSDTTKTGKNYWEFFEYAKELEYTIKRDSK